MNQHLKAVKISDKVYWVGAIDWTLRDFHGYETRRGSTYNAYLVIGEKPILIDTVKAQFKDELLSRIASVTDPRRIQYIISNHTEMDHSGCLPELIDLVKPEKVFASVNGVDALNEHFKFNQEILPVKDGDTMELAGLKFTTLEARMLHWPDSMFTYLVDEKMLFSSDAFGMHLASSERFDDEIDQSVLEYEAAKYYANIILLYSPIVLKTLERISKLGIELKMIAPDHGPVWRKNIKRALELYKKWAEQKPLKKAVVVYDTMWQSTAKMAKAVSDGLTTAGISNKVMKLREDSRADVVTELLEAGALIVGSPTLNNNIFPTLADLLTYVKGLRFKNKISAVFGSYGWSGEATRQLREMLEAMKMPVQGEVSGKYVPNPEVLDQCFALGGQVADKLKEIGRNGGAA